MRYAYGISAALLVAGGVATLSGVGPAGAQVAANDSQVIRAAAPVAGAPMSFADLTEQLQPAVVNISTKQKVRVSNNPFAGTPFDGLFGRRSNRGPQTREAQSLGSGFIISADGYVVTNNHVVAPGNRNATIESITVIMPDRTEYEAKLVGRDAASDIAVLKINAKKDLPFVKFGDSETARVGDWVIAIGNPFGLGGTVTTGILSAIHRNTGQGGAYDRFLQTDASINRGNSGGPMFDLNGNVIGINNAIISPTGGNVGIGFAIPSEVAVPVVNSLRKGEKVTRGYLGIRYDPVNEDIAASFGIEKNVGVLVQEVIAGDPAAKAGIKPGDVILGVKGKKVTSDNTLAFVIANTAPGATIPIDLLRNGKRMKTNVRIGKATDDKLAQNFNNDPQSDFSDQDDESSEQASADALGLAVIDLTPRIAQQIRVNEDTQAVIVNAVDPDSDAARKGLRRGDLILSIDGRRTASPSEVNAALSAAKRRDKEAVLLRVQPRGTKDRRFVAVRIKDS